MPRSSKSAPTVNDIVRIEFLDHANGGEGPMRFEVIGRITEIKKEAYRVDFWRYTNPIDRASDSNTKDNEDWYWIVRSTITELKILK
jgi:hypothetical protein